MRRVSVTCLWAVAALLLCGAGPSAQEKPASTSADPRVGLKPGFRDAGAGRAQHGAGGQPAAPDGFFDPKIPAGDPTPPEVATPDTKGDACRRSAADKPKPPALWRGSGLDFANSDLAFSGNHLFVGNYHGFNIYDIENARQAAAARLGRLPRRPGRRVGLRQPAVHVGRADARPRRLRHAGRRAEPVSNERFRGVRIFDITDIKKPKQVAAVQTCRGSHTHTLVADPERQGQHLRLRLGHRPACARARSWPAAPARIRRTIRTRRSSAST